MRHSSNTKIQFKTDIVKRYERGESSYQIARDEGCSHNAVIRELKRRGINTGLRFWTKKEIVKFKKLYSIFSKEELLREFPNRKEESIGSMAIKLKLKKKELKKTCKGCSGEITIKYRRKYNYKEGLCSECAKKQWENNNLENGIKRKKQWLQRNPEYLKRYVRRPEVKEHRREYQKRFRIESPKFRLDQNMCNFIRQSLKGKKEGWKWEVLVGYTLNDLIGHLEKQFDNKMNWENYGSYWHVDHVRPRSLFKYTVPEDREFKECWSLKNLQPLEKTANLKKSDTFTL